MVSGYREGPAIRGGAATVVSTEAASDSSGTTPRRGSTSRSRWRGRTSLLLACGSRTAAEEVDRRARRGPGRLFAVYPPDGEDAALYFAERSELRLVTVTEASTRTWRRFLKRTRPSRRERVLALKRRLPHRHARAVSTAAPARNGDAPREAPATSHGACR